MRWEDLARPKPCPYGSALYRRVIESPLWVAQLKVDGWRVLVEVLRDLRVTAVTRHGEKLAVPSGLATAVSGVVPALTILDCELERPWVKLWVIDVLTVAGQDVSKRPLSERIVRLNALMNGGSDSLQAVPTIRERKDDYYHAVVKSGGEGVVLKRLSDPYPYRGQVWLKVKPELN